MLLLNIPIKQFSQVRSKAKRKNESLKILFVNNVGQMILPQGSLTLIQRPGQQAQLVQTIQPQQQQQQTQGQQQIRIQQTPQIVKATSDIWRTSQIQQNQHNNVQPIQVQQQVVQPAQQQQRKGLTLSVRIFF